MYIHVVNAPSYVRADSPGNTAEFRAHMMHSGQFETLAGKRDLYIPFVELSVRLLAENGYSSLIIPDAFTHADYAEASLNWLTANSYLSQIDYFPGLEIFEGVGVHSVIVTSQKQAAQRYRQRTFHSPTDYTELPFDTYPTTFRIDARPRITGASPNSVLLSDVCYISVGIVGNSHEKLAYGEFEVADLLSPTKDAKHLKPYYEGKDIEKWRLTNLRWLEYGTDRSPAKWRRPAFPELFEGGPKIVAMRSPGLIPRNFLDKQGDYFNESAIGFKRWCDLKGVDNRSLSSTCKDKKIRAGFEQLSAAYSYSFLTAILNSRLLACELNTDRRSNIHIYPDDYRGLYLPLVTPAQQIELETLADQMLALTEQMQTQTKQVAGLLQINLNLPRLTDKLLNWPALEWSGLLTELAKQKVGISLPKQMEWQSFFEAQRTQIQALQAARTATDQQIDRLVYALYGLTDADIALIEA